MFCSFIFKQYTIEVNKKVNSLEANAMNLLRKHEKEV